VSSRSGQRGAGPYQGIVLLLDEAIVIFLPRVTTSEFGYLDLEPKVAQQVMIEERGISPRSTASSIGIAPLGTLSFEGTMPPSDTLGE